MQEFDRAFPDRPSALMRWRRDLRRFRTDPVPEAMLMHCLDAFVLSPSVGRMSQPWRLIRVQTAAAQLRGAAESQCKAMQGRYRRGSR